MTDSTLRVKASAIGADTYLSKIIAIVEQAQNTKPQIQKLADTIMKYFVPTALIIAVLAAIFWGFFAKTYYPDINHIQFALISFV